MIRLVYFINFKIFLEKNKVYIYTNYAQNNLDIILLKYNNNTILHVLTLLLIL